MGRLEKWVWVGVCRDWDAGTVRGMDPEYSAGRAGGWQFAPDSVLELPRAGPGGGCGPADAETMARHGKWFGITPEDVQASKAARQNGAGAKIVPLPVVAAA